MAVRRAGITRFFFAAMRSESVRRDQTNLSREGGQHVRLARAMPVKTLGGTWTAETYRIGADIPNWTVTESCDIKLRFTPNDRVDAGKIALVQMILRRFNGTNPDAGLAAQALATGGAAAKAKASRSDGVGHLDRMQNANNPVYGAPNLPVNGSVYNTAVGTFDDHYVTGERTTNNNYQTGATGRAARDAILYDRPNSGGALNDDFMHFETAAISLAGPQKNVWYGSVEWGWTKTNGAIVLLPLAVVSMGTPSARMTALVRKWNTGIDQGGNANIKLKMTVIPGTLSEDDLSTNQKRSTAATTITTARDNVGYFSHTNPKTDRRNGDWLAAAVNGYRPGE